MMYKEEVHGYPLIFGYFGALLMFIGVITLLPLLSLLFYPQDQKEAYCFILPGVGALICGYLLFLQIRGKEKGKLMHNQDAVIVVGCWMMAIFVTALPFVLSGNYNFTQAIFETTSGWSTTGLSVVDVEKTSHLFLVHRTTILFFGGIGLVLVMLSVLSDSYGMRLYHAEGHADRLLPNLLKSARVIIGIYSGYILGGIVLYMLFGMSCFDAFIHSVGALSTGGFSSHAQSIGYFQSAAIDYITILLMLLGNVNFLAHLFLVRGKWKRFFHYCEVKCSFILLSFITPILMFFFVQSLDVQMHEGFRIALFQAVSALTTTGFQTVSSFPQLPSIILLIMIVLQLIGGGSGSTAGGIKQYRICILTKSILWSLRDGMYPQNRIHARKIAKVDCDTQVTKEEIASTGIYVFFFLLLFFLGTLILCGYGYSIQDAMFEFSSALSTVGLSAGIMIYDAPIGVLWTGIAGMFIGRLEIYVVFLALMRLYKDERNAYSK